jgi:hypothetical protein
LGGFLLIEAPAVLTAVLVIVLGRHTRGRLLEMVGVTALFVSVWARLDRPWASLDDGAVACAVAALLVLGASFALRRLPKPA